MLFVGDDWSEAHHDIEIQDDQGLVLARRRLPEGIAGIGVLHELVADHLGEHEEPDQVLVGIETDRGPWVQALIAAGYTVYPINPLQASRYRERLSCSGAKSDPGDAHVLAELVRVDRVHHRPAAGDSELAEQVKVLTRSHQGLIWSRQRHTNTLRSMLREFYPAALAAFGDDLAGRDALAVLAVAPTPDQGRRLTRSRIQGVLKRAGRQRNLPAATEKIHTGLHSQQLTARPGVVPAYAASVTALVTVIQVTARQVEVLTGQVEACFGQHPDARINRSQPRHGDKHGAPVLAEFGDDPHRYTDARARKNYSGMSPITRASGTKKVVLARYARNRRLSDALYQQAFSALNGSPGARAQYDAQRARGATHHQALRTLANRLVGILHGCLTHRATYDEATAWSHRQPAAA